MAEQETPGPIDVHVVLALMVDELASIAWQKMGLQPDMLTGKIEPDLSQAKVAIDAVAQLIPHFEPKLEDDDRRRIQNLQSDLKINYVQRASGN